MAVRTMRLNDNTKNYFPKLSICFAVRARESEGLEIAKFVGRSGVVNAALIAEIVSSDPSVLT